MIFFFALVACVAGVQRGGRGKVECEREARSLGDRASRSHSTSPLPPLCTPATQAIALVTVAVVLNPVL